MENGRGRKEDLTVPVPRVAWDVDGLARTRWSDMSRKERWRAALGSSCSRTTLAAMHWRSQLRPLGPSKLQEGAAAMKKRPVSASTAGAVLDVAGRQNRGPIVGS